LQLRFLSKRKGLFFSSSKVEYIKHIFSFPEDTRSGLSDPFSDMSLDIEDLIIPWSELVLKEKIGAGSFGTVHRADWNGSDVAVKILMEPDFHPERLKEFLRDCNYEKFATSKHCSSYGRCYSTT